MVRGTFIVTIITAALQLLAVGILVWAICEAHSTTTASKETLETAKKQLKENRSASDKTTGKLVDLLETQKTQAEEMKEVADELIGLRQTTILGHMLLKWDSVDIRFSAVRLEWLLDKDGRQRKDENVFKHFDENDPFSQDKNMAIPRSFETFENLVTLGVIEEPVAISAFHADASYYWHRYEKLIEAIRNLGKYRHYQFPGFERFTMYMGIPTERNETNADGGGGS